MSDLIGIIKESQEMNISDKNYRLLSLSAN